MTPTTVGATRASRAAASSTNVRGQPALQRGGDRTGQVDQRPGRPGRPPPPGGGQPGQDADRRPPPPRGPPTPPPASAAGGSRPAARCVPAATSPSGPAATTAAVTTPATGHTSEATAAATATTAADQFGGVDRPPPGGEPRARPGQVVLALGHPQPTEPGRDAGRHAGGHGDPGQALVMATGRRVERPGVDGRRHGRRPAAGASRQADEDGPHAARPGASVGVRWPTPGSTDSVGVREERRRPARPPPPAPRCRRPPTPGRPGSRSRPCRRRTARPAGATKTSRITPLAAR